jgi:hypothetical protein
MGNCNGFGCDNGARFMGVWIFILFFLFFRQVLVMDNGLPQLSSTTRVVIQVDDVNDHGPEFDQKLYKVQIPANAEIEQKLFQVSNSI